MSYLTLCRDSVLSRNIEDYPDGIVIPVDKPWRWTSADVIRKVKWMAVKHFGKRNLKVGHAGTLDPLATGVLLVCVGKATKLAESFQRERKQYIAGVTFGATTPSFDREKDVDKFCSMDGVSEEALRKLLPSFIGEQDQVAPLFSAKSVDGVRVYELARKRFKAGLPVEDAGILNASRISIYNLELIDFRRGAPSDPVTAAPSSLPTCGWAPPSNRAEGGRPPEGSTSPEKSFSPINASNRINVAEVPPGLPQAEILVDCSKGTYIRALARDVGEALGSGAFLHSLRRTRNGGFRVEDALSIDDIANIFTDKQISQI